MVVITKSLGNFDETLYLIKVPHVDEEVFNFIWWNRSGEIDENNGFQ